MCDYHDLGGQILFVATRVALKQNTLRLGFSRPVSFCIVRLSPHRRPKHKFKKVALDQERAHTHNSGSQISGRHDLAQIRIFDGESIEGALRRFKRQVQQEGIIKDSKRHAFYLKPGERKRLKSKLARKLRSKKVRRSASDRTS